MKPDYKKLFEELAQEQEEKGVTPICPRCGKDIAGHMDTIANAVSRHENVAICHFCGEDEAMRDYGKQGCLPAHQWYFIRNILRGLTFGDLLRQNKELDCSLIIGDSDMPADFVWYKENRMTEAGMEYYAEIMQAPYEKLPNGNIVIYCDNYDLGDDFCLSAAGYTSNERYKKYFLDCAATVKESPDISGIYLDGVPWITGGCVKSVVSRWIELDARLPVRAEQVDAVAHYVVSVDTRTNTLKYLYWILNAEGEESIEEIHLSETERAALAAAFEKYCLDQYSLSIVEYWKNHKRQ